MLLSFFFNSILPLFPRPSLPRHLETMRGKTQKSGAHRDTANMAQSGSGSGLQGNTKPLNPPRDTPKPTAKKKNRRAKDRVEPISTLTLTLPLPLPEGYIPSRKGKKRKTTRRCGVCPILFESGAKPLLPRSRKLTWNRFRQHPELPVTPLRPYKELRRRTES